MESTEATPEQNIDLGFSELLGEVQSIEGSLQLEYTDPNKPPEEPRIENKVMLKWLNDLGHNILDLEKEVNSYMFGEKTLDGLQTKRNQLNRQISTLKKVNLKEGEFVNPVCPDCNCSEGWIRKQNGKWWCEECYKYIEPVEHGSKEHQETPSMKRLRN